MKVVDVSIPASNLDKAAELIQRQLGPSGIAKVGGKNWWQWRYEPGPPLLRAEWIEMRDDYEARKWRKKQQQEQGPRKEQRRRNGGSAETQSSIEDEELKRRRSRFSRSQKQQRKQPEEFERIMLYIHGGAYYFGSVDAHRYQIQRHARKLRARVLAPRYRLAPQFPFPCALQDCLAAYLYLIERHRPSTILLAGDSAGAGTIVSTLVILRDQGIALPAGAILLSPWVDLTHSFPSLSGDDSRDYIPASGFMHKPSQSWPPFRPEELAIGMDASSNCSLKSSKQSQSTSRSSLLLSQLKDNKAEVAPSIKDDAAPPDNKSTGSNSSQNDVPPTSKLPTQANEPLKIKIDGEVVEIKDQIQLYAPNHLLNHPLVSPILQPSLGGLPPLLIQVGGGELLRDEQIYLAHKAADPVEYPPSKEILDEYDPDRNLLYDHKPTDVQLQVWDDMCHVPHTFSFSSSVKLMYKAVAQFGAWALLKAQEEEDEKEKERENRPQSEEKSLKEQTDNEDKTATSNDVETTSEAVSNHHLRSLDASEDPSGTSTPNEDRKEITIEVAEMTHDSNPKHDNPNNIEINLTPSNAPPTPSLTPSPTPPPSPPLPTQQPQTSNTLQPRSQNPRKPPKPASSVHPQAHTHVLSAAYPTLPPFENHMLRQAVSSQGLIRPLAPPEELPALQLQPSEIGVVKDGPVLKRWLEAQKAWTARHGSLRGEVLKMRIREMQVDVEGEMMRKRERKKQREKQTEKEGREERQGKPGTSEDVEEKGSERGGWLNGLGEGELPPLSALVGRRGRNRDKSSDKGYESAWTQGQEDNGKEKEKKGMWGSWGTGWWNFW